MNKKQSIIKGAIFLFLGKTFNIIISSLQILLIPRLLGPANMGFYSYWLSVYFIIARLLGLGGQHIIIKFLPELRIKNELKGPTLIKKVVWLKFPLFLLIVSWGFFFWTKEVSYFLIIASASLFFSLNLVGESVIYSYNKMGTYALLPLIRFSARTILVICLFYLYYSTGIIWGIFAAPLISFFLSLILVLRLIPSEQKKLDYPFRHYFSFGFWIYISVAIQGMIVWLITILSKMQLKEMAVVGYFGVGVQICFSTIMLIFFINESILPSLVEFRVQSDKKFKDSLHLAWKYTNLLLFPLILGGVVLTKPLVTFIIGQDYKAGAIIIQMFLPSIIFFSWIRYHTQILFVFGKKIIIFLTQVINLLTFLGLWFYLISQGKINLAALSLCGGALAGYLFSFFLSYRLEKVKNYSRNFLKPLTASILMALLVNFLKVQSATQLLVAILTGLFSYALFLILIKGVGKNDLEILKEFLRSVKILSPEIDV